MNDQPSHPPGLWKSVVLFGIAFFAGARVSGLLSIAIPGSTYTSLWLPAGLYVGVLLLHPIRIWPWFVLAACAANVVNDLPLGTPWPVILGFFAANTAAALLGAWWVRKFVAERPSLATVREFLVLLGCSRKLPWRNA